MSVRPERECDPRKRRTRALLQTAPLYKLRHSKLRHSKLRHSKLRPCGCSGRDRSHLGGSRAANRVGPCVGTLLALVLEPCRPLCWNLADPCVGTLPILVLEPCRPLCWNRVGPCVGTLPILVLEPCRSLCWNLVGLCVGTLSALLLAASAPPMGLAPTAPRCPRCYDQHRPLDLRPLTTRGSRPALTWPLGSGVRSFMRRSSPGGRKVCGSVRGREGRCADR